MANIILGCDSNGYNDAQCQNTVRNILQQNGHTVTNLPIAPGPFSVYSYSSAGKGKIGIYLIAAGTNSISDFIMEERVSIIVTLVFEEISLVKMLEQNQDSLQDQSEKTPTVHLIVIELLD